MNERETLSDETNPIYLFSTTPTTLLVQIVNTKIDAKQLAEKELQARGLDNKGDWVGFKKKQV